MGCATPEEADCCCSQVGFDSTQSESWNPSTTTTACADCTCAGATNGECAGCGDACTCSSTWVATGTGAENGCQCGGNEMACACTECSGCDTTGTATQMACPCPGE